MSTSSMTKIVDTECPGCKKKFGTAVDLNELELSPGKFQHQEVQEKTPVSELESMVEKAIAKREAAKVEPPKEKEKAKVKIPAHIKKYRCKTCDKLHDNPDFEGVAKGKCDTCDTHFTNRSKGKCPYCKDGEIEAIDESDLESMGLYSEDMEEEEHEH